jgi:hypothetical protein
MLFMLPAVLAHLPTPDAYLDPGSGSFILQMLVAAILGASFYFRSAIAKLFGKKKDDDTSGDSSDNDQK